MKKIPIIIIFILITANVFSQEVIITVNANDYDGVYFLDNDFSKRFDKNTMTITLSPGLHFFNTGATVGDAYIYFNVNNSGNIDYLNPSSCADYSGGTITFKTCTISIDPEKYNGTFMPSFLRDPIKGAKKYKVIKNIRYNLDNRSGADCGENTFSYFYFFVNEVGKIILNDKNAAYIVNDSELHLNAVKYEDDFSTYKAVNNRFNITGYGWMVVNGKKSFNFVKSLCTTISYNTIDGNSHVIHIMP